jgi:hypothetical protein
MMLSLGRKLGLDDDLRRETKGFSLGLRWHRARVSSRAGQLRLRLRLLADLGHTLWLLNSRFS